MKGTELTTWLTEALGAEVKNVVLTSLNDAGGKHSDMQVVSLSADGIEHTYVLKQTASLESALRLGTTREAVAYQCFRDEGIQWNFLPRVLRSECNEKTGEMAILMERLEGTQLGLYFGSGTHLNWGRELSTEISALQACILAFEGVAKLHRYYWNKRDDLVSMEWLRGSDFIDGRNEAGFMALQNYSRGLWEADAKCLRDAWHPELVALLDASFSRVSWDTFCAQWQSGKRAVTLRHGDFHPANCWRRTDGTLAVFDWEMVACGSGPQDLGQFVISHMVIEERRAGEEQFLRAYHNALDITDYSYEQLLDDYAMGGVCHWLWLLPLLANMPVFDDPLKMKWFHDQTLAFARDHNIDASNVEMPRVN